MRFKLQKVYTVNECIATPFLQLSCVVAVYDLAKHRTMFFLAIDAVELYQLRSLYHHYFILLVN